MNKILTTMFISFSSSYALADRYGVEESLLEGDASWGAVALVIIIFAYLHFKEK